jgi:DNA-binding beta-propeller fold protein YncE
MKPIKILLTLTCISWLVTGASGAPVDSGTAAAVVKGWLRANPKPLGQSLGAQVKNVETYKDNTGSPLYHVVNLEPSGFVIVPAEDQVEPIIAFVDKGKFDSSPANPLGALISRDLPARVARARAKGNSHANLANSNKWQTLLQSSTGGLQANGIIGSGITDLRIAPFTQTLWDQGPVTTVVTNIVVVTEPIYVVTHFDTNTYNYGANWATELWFTNDPPYYFFINGPGSPAYCYATGNPTYLYNTNAFLTNATTMLCNSFVYPNINVQIIFTNQFGDVVQDTWTGLWGPINSYEVTATGTQGQTVTNLILASFQVTEVVTDQKACYNYFTPPHGGVEDPSTYPPGRGNFDNYPCGCVATAMAQLMYYFQYPNTGVGTPCFTVTVDGNPYAKNLLGGDYNGGPYKWSSMPLAPNYYSLTIPQAQAIGALTHDAGFAVYMQYTASSSGAYLTDAKTALVNTFKYNNAVINSVTNLDTGCFECSLYNMMNPNLDARLPVILGITGDPGGHAIVVDGYGYSYGAMYHHLNMGWSGAYNAWYSLPIIDMYDPTTQTWSYFWDVVQCLYNVYTNGSGEIISGRVLDNNTGLPVAGAAVTAVRSVGYSFSTTTDTNGIYAIAGLPSSSAYTITVICTNYFPASSNYNTGVSLDNGFASGNIWGANFSLIPAVGPPVIAIQPASQIESIGSNAMFNVAALGQLPLTYEWQYQTNDGSLAWFNLTDGGNISGSQTAALTISQVNTNNNGEPFRCIVTNPLGTTNSLPAVLSVNISPYLTFATLAGSTGTSGSADGIGSAALFNSPRGIAVDNNTNVYVADMHNHTIRLLTYAGGNWTASTIAGLAGSSGSADGTNSSARFNGPYGVALDSGGNHVYVADTGNSVIRKLTPAGTNWVVQTIAGLPGSAGSVDGTNNIARFRYPTGVALDASGNVYVADEGNNTIRRITPSGTNWVVTTLAGLTGVAGSADGTNNTALFSNPFGITVDSSGNVYVVDQYSSIVRKLKSVGVNWVVTTIAGLAYNTGSADGTGSAARFNGPTGIAADPAGNLYVADEANNTIRRLTPNGTNWVAFTVAGLAGQAGSVDGIGAAARFNGPYGIAVNNNTNIFVADSGNDTIRGIPLNVALGAVNVRLLNQQATGIYNLTWNAVNGHTYQIQYKTNLTQGAWVNLTNVTASSWNGTASIPVCSDPRRFYRIVGQ